MKVAIVGLGYIGLPTSVVMAGDSVEVVGVDIDQGVVEAVNQGRAPIVEPGLGELLKEKVDAGYLTATTVVPAADYYLIAVPTPITSNNLPDISYVIDAARSIAPALTSGSTVIIESTSPPGTTLAVRDVLRELRPDLAFNGPASEASGRGVSIAYCPERVLPGRIIEELKSNDRIIGGLTPHCGSRAKDLYGAFCLGELLETDATSAEVAKLAENAFRDVNIAFANELANIAGAIDVNVWEVIRLANRHPRVNILNPGPGVGGHCIAVDPWFLASAAPSESKLIPTARYVNNARPEAVVNEVMSVIAKADLSERVRVACLGLAFKPNIDDLRESPAVEVVRLLSQQGGLEVIAVEPHVDVLPGPLAGSGVRLESLERALELSDVLVMLVDHDAFEALRERALATHPLRVDTRGFWALPR